MAVKEKDIASKTEEEKSLDENMKLLKNLRLQKIVDVNMIRVFIAVWLVAAILVSIPVFRPKYSELEKRNLKEFPELSFKALTSGEFFDEINLWFSDTFPLRDDLMALNTKITDCYGLNEVQVYGEIIEGDEIPDIVPADTNTDTLPDTQQPDEPAVVEPDPVEPTTPVIPPATQEPAVEQIGAMLIVGNSAYEYYNFSQAAADSYSNTINRAAALLAGKSQVYDMIIPTSMAITLPDQYKNTTKTSDQKKAIEYMYSNISSNVVKIDSYTTLENHKNEYIYFRTDHHWTALGAYYSYRELMAAKGVTPAELTDFKEYKFDGFLGSFYTESGQKSSLGNTPDYVMAYEPTQLEYIKTFTASGTTDKHIVSNGDNLSASNKYLTFICGDHAYGIMTNPTINDGSSCLVIKDSYGNAMVSYLTQHYQNVYVVDYRHISQVFPGTIVQFVDERKIQDVIFVNNVSSTRNQALVNAMAAFVG